MTCGACASSLRRTNYAVGTCYVVGNYALGLLSICFSPRERLLRSAAIRLLLVLCDCLTPV